MLQVLRHSAINRTFLAYLVIYLHNPVLRGGVIFGGILKWKDASNEAGNTVCPYAKYYIRKSSQTKIISLIMK
jgi:hypothetical protein